LILAGLLVAGSGSVLAITPDQVDDFESGSTAGWSEGGFSPTPPQIASDGGPMGAGEGYLLNASTGTAGPGGKMVMFNQAQWTGDYNAAGIQQIEMDLVSLLGSLDIRVAVLGVREAGTCRAVPSACRPTVSGGRRSSCSTTFR
jgi:hypothetical protein